MTLYTNVVSRITDRASSIPIYLYDNNTGERIEEHEILDLLNNPSFKENNRRGLINTMLTYKLVTGNAFLHKSAPRSGVNAGRAKNLVVLPSQDVQIRLNRGSDNIIDGYQMQSSGSSTYFPADSVLHIKENNIRNRVSADSLYGYSRLLTVTDLLLAIQESSKVIGGIMKNRGPQGFFYICFKR